MSFFLIQLASQTKGNYTLIFVSIDTKCIRGFFLQIWIKYEKNILEYYSYIFGKCIRQIVIIGASSEDLKKNCRFLLWKWTKKLAIVLINKHTLSQTLIKSLSQISEIIVFKSQSSKFTSLWFGCMVTL